MQLYKKLKQFKDLVIAQHDGISHLKDMCNIAIAMQLEVLKQSGNADYATCYNT